MAKKAGLNHDLFIGGLQVGGDVGAISTANSPRGSAIVTGIDKTAEERILTNVDGNLTFSHFFNDASGQIHAALKSLPKTDVLVLWAMGATIGCPVRMDSAKQLNYDWTRGADRSLAGETSMISGAGFAPEYGVMLTAGKKTDSGAANGATLDSGAQTCAGAAAMLQVDSFSGTNVTVDVEHSCNGSSWSNLIVFTAVCAAPAAERKTVSGAVKRYIRAVSNGTFSCAQFIVGVRRGTAQDDCAYS